MRNDSHFHHSVSKEHSRMVQCSPYETVTVLNVLLHRKGMFLLCFFSSQGKFVHAVISYMYI